MFATVPDPARRGARGFLRWEGMPGGDRLTADTLEEAQAIIGDGMGKFAQ